MVQSRHGPNNGEELSIAIISASGLIPSTISLGHYLIL